MKGRHAYYHIVGRHRFLLSVVLLLVAVASLVVGLLPVRNLILSCVLSVPVVLGCTAIVLREARRRLGKSDEAGGVCVTDGSSVCQAGVSPLDSVLSDLSEDGVRADLQDGVVTFGYQGGYFQVSTTDGNMLRIVFPSIYNVPVTRQDFLCRVLNNVNLAYAVCKLVAVSSGGDASIEVHGFADILYDGDRDRRKNMLRGILATFFSQQRNLAVAMAVYEAGELSDGNVPESGCTSAYKDISLN